jgi:hypothetical protein
MFSLTLPLGRSLPSPDFKLAHCAAISYTSHFDRARMLHAYDPLKPRHRLRNIELRRGRSPTVRILTSTTRYHASKKSLHSDRGINLPVEDKKLSLAAINPHQNPQLLSAGIHLDQALTLKSYNPVPGVLENSSVRPKPAARGDMSGKRRAFRHTPSSTGRVEYVRGSTIIFILERNNEADPENAAEILEDMQYHMLIEAMECDWNKYDVEAVIKVAKEQGWTSETPLELDDPTDINGDESLKDSEQNCGSPSIAHEPYEASRMQPIDDAVAGCNVQGWWTNRESRANRGWRTSRSPNIGPAKHH